MLCICEVYEIAKSDIRFVIKLVNIVGVRLHLGWRLKLKVAMM
jgi:hypothetical protein